MDASRAEIKIREILEEAGLNFKMEYIFPDLKHIMVVLYVLILSYLMMIIILIFN